MKIEIEISDSRISAEVNPIIRLFSGAVNEFLYEPNTSHTWERIRRFLAVNSNNQWFRDYFGPFPPPHKLSFRCSSKLNTPASIVEGKLTMQATVQMRKDTKPTTILFTVSPY